MESVASELLRNDTTRRSEYLKSLNLSAEFKNKFSDALSRFILLAAGNILPVPPTQTVNLEGTMGIMPPPAKRIITQDIMQGQAPTPLKVREEIIQTGAPERPVSLVSIHLIVEVDPVTAGSGQEQANMAAVLTFLKPFLAGKNISIESDKPNEPTVRVAKIRALFHLLQGGAFGQYALEEHTLNHPQDIAPALAAYQKSLDFVLPFQPNLNPSDEKTAHLMLNPQIISAVAKDAGVSKISIPVLISPKNQSYHRGLIDAFLNGDPFIIVSTDSHPKLVYYDFQDRCIKPIT